MKSTSYFLIFLSSLMFTCSLDDADVLDVSDIIQVKFMPSDEIVADGSSVTQIGIKVDNANASTTYPLAITTTIGTFLTASSSEPRKLSLTPTTGDTLNIFLRSDLTDGIGKLTIKTNDSKVQLDKVFTSSRPTDSIVKISYEPSTKELIADGVSKLNIGIKLDPDLANEFLPLSINTNMGNFLNDDKMVEVRPDSTGKVTVSLISDFEVGEATLTYSLKDNSFLFTDVINLIRPNGEDLISVQYDNNSPSANGLETFNMTVNTNVVYYPLSFTIDNGYFTSNGTQSLKAFDEKDSNGQSIIEIRTSIKEGDAIIRIKSDSKAIIASDTITYTPVADSLLNFEIKPNDTILADGFSDYYFEVSIHSDLANNEDNSLFNRIVTLKNLNDNSSLGNVTYPTGIMGLNGDNLVAEQVVKNHVVEASLSIGTEKISVLKLITFSRAYPTFLNLGFDMDSIKRTENLTVTTHLNRPNGMVSDQTPVLYFSVDSLNNPLGGFSSVTKSSNGQSTASFTFDEEYSGAIDISSLVINGSDSITVSRTIPTKN